MSVSPNVNINVWIVEDDEGDVHLLRRGFEDFKADVKLFFCKSAPELVNRLSRGGTSGNMQGPLPDVILLDINLPGVDGFSACRYIRSREPLKNIPIIFLTGRKALEDVQAAIRAGGNYYFVKPVDFQKLMEKIRELVSLSPKDQSG